eukprot:2394312-Prymnesium_polylepis.1
MQTPYAAPRVSLWFASARDPRVTLGRPRHTHDALPATVSLTLSGRSVWSVRDGPVSFAQRFGLLGLLQGVGSCPPLRAYRCVACGRSIQWGRASEFALHPASIQGGGGEKGPQGSGTKT